MKYLTTGEKVLFFICEILLILGTIAIIFLPTVGLKEPFEGTDMTVRIAISPINLILKKTEVSPKIQGHSEEIKLLNKFLELDKGDFFDYLNYTPDIEMPKDSSDTSLSMLIILLLILLMFNIFVNLVPNKNKQPQSKEMKALNRWATTGSFFRTLGVSLAFVLTLYLVLASMLYKLEGGPGHRIPDIVIPIGFIIALNGIHAIFNEIYRKAVAYSGLETNKRIHHEMLDDDISSNPPIITEAQENQPKAIEPNEKCLSKSTNTQTESVSMIRDKEENSLTVELVREKAAVLGEYKQLMDNGIISEEEYEKKRKELLSL